MKKLLINLLVIAMCGAGVTALAAPNTDNILTTTGRKTNYADTLEKNNTIDMDDVNDIDEDDDLDDMDDINDIDDDDDLDDMDDIDDVDGNDDLDD